MTAIDQRVAAAFATVSRILGGPYARRFGTGLSVLLLLLICRALWLERGQLAQIDMGGAFFVTGAFSIAVAVLGNLLGSAGNWLLLRKHAAVFTLPYCIALNGLAQMAKYLPGNVLHLVGRFYVVREHTDARTALYFSLTEVLLLCLSACSLGLWYLHYLQPDSWPLPLLMLLSVLALGGGVVVLRRLRLLKVSAGDLGAVLLLHVVSYLSYGLAFSLLLQQVFGVAAGPLLCTALFALAFIVGYLTPGASGGLGVREFAFTLLAQPLLDPAAALAVVVLFRFFSVAGDLLFGLVSLVTRHWYRVDLLRPKP